MKWSDLQKELLATIDIGKENILEFSAVNMAECTVLNNDENYNKIVKKINSFIKNK